MSSEPPSAHDTAPHPTPSTGVTAMRPIPHQRDMVPLPPRDHRPTRDTTGRIVSLEEDQAASVRSAYEALVTFEPDEILDGWVILKGTRKV